MITANVINRVFRIRHRRSEATAFTLEVDGREYLVTAKHVAENLSGEGTIDVFGRGDWQPLEARLVGHAEGDRDISVLALNAALTPLGLPMPATSKGVVYGQDVFFLGFPYGYVGHYAFGSGGFPLPLVKKATVSLLEKERFLLDGHNNRGFSGGPVVFAERGRTDFKVFAVVSGFQAVNEPIYVGDSAARSADGQPIVFRYNTGIVVTWAVDFAVELIRARPIGAITTSAG